MEYNFRLKYQLSAEDSELDDIIERLGAAGCEDALVGIGRPGRLALDFTRDSESAQAAVRSAINHVQRAVPSATLIEAGPDFVGLSDIAELTGVSRQAMRQLMLAHPSDFPPPVHEGSLAIWHLADVLDWLQARGRYQVQPELLETASMALELNLARDRGRAVQRHVEQQPIMAG